MLKGDITFRHFADYYPSLVDKVESYEYYDYGEIIITYKDGRKVLYDQFGSTLDSLRELDNPQEFRYRFGRRLNKKIHEMGVNPEELSKRSGLSRATISNYVNGVRSPDIFRLRSLAKALNCTVEDLLHFPR